MKINDANFNSVYAFIFEGNIESDDQEEALQRNTWEYPVCSM